VEDISRELNPIERILAVLPYCSIPARVLRLSIRASLKDWIRTRRGLTISKPELRSSQLKRSEEGARVVGVANTGCGYWRRVAAVAMTLELGPSETNEVVPQEYPVEGEAIDAGPAEEEESYLWGKRAATPELRTGDVR
jgi:hypothetical protein